jgi:cytochrome b561
MPVILLMRPEHHGEQTMNTESTYLDRESVAVGTKASLPLRVLHWLMALAIAGAWVFIYSKGLFEKGSVERAFLTHAHILTGLAVLALLPLRGVVRWLWPLPPVTPSMGRWQIKLAKLVQISLYACMLAMPVLGILFVQAAGREITVLGFTLPTLIGMDKTLSHAIKEVHEALGVTMLYLVAIHVGAAAVHHFLQRDDTLRRML